MIAEPSRDFFSIPDVPVLNLDHPRLDGCWLPRLSTRGAEVVNDRHRVLLVWGDKLSGKTVTICHKVAKHLWEINGARVAIVFKRTESAKHGVWPDLTQMVIPDWQRGGGMLAWIRRPSFSADTKRLSAVVRNAYGTESFVTLFSVWNESPSAIEYIFKNTRFSFFYINETDQFERPEVLFAARDQLRAHGVAYEDHQIVMDCNPPDMGDRHWLYDLFFRETVDKRFVGVCRQICMTLADNPFVSQRQKDELIASHASDPRRYARFLEHKWLSSTTGRLFDGVFDSSQHLVGEIYPDRSIDRWKVLLPSDVLSGYICGWDLGDGVNHAFVLMSKRVTAGIQHFEILDEVVSIGMELTLSDFAKSCWNRVRFWRDYAVSKGVKSDDVVFRHWSDSSAFMFKATIGVTQAKQVMNLTDGEIRLDSVVKGAGSVDARVSLLRKLLFEKRITISVRCQQLIDCLTNIKSATGQIGKKDRHKHVLDAVTYALMNEALDDAPVFTPTNRSYRVISTAW